MKYRAEYSEECEYWVVLNEERHFSSGGYAKDQAIRMANELNAGLENNMEKPAIAIDKDAIRFAYGDGEYNLFWKDLFRNTNRGGRTSFQTEIMDHLYNMYNECVKNDIEPCYEEDEEGWIDLYGRYENS